MSEVILDTITGKSTATTITIGSTPVVSASANSMTIRGEGSAQTSIQQGLAKSWFRADGGAGTVVIGDSLNKSAITDNGTGQYTLTYTNNMANTNYTQAWDQKIDYATAATTNLCGLWASSGAVGVKTTSQYKVNSQDLGSAQEDHSQVGSIVMGDLA